MTGKKETEKQPGLFGKRDELINAINIEMSELTERAEALGKRIEAAEKQQDELEGRLRNLGGLLKDLRAAG